MNQTQQHCKKHQCSCFIHVSLPRQVWSNPLLLELIAGNFLVPDDWWIFLRYCLLLAIHFCQLYNGICLPNLFIEPITQNLRNLPNVYLIHFSEKIISNAGYFWDHNDCINGFLKTLFYIDIFIFQWCWMLTSSTYGLIRPIPMLPFFIYSTLAKYTYIETIYLFKIVNNL